MKITIHYRLWLTLTVLLIVFALVLSIIAFLFVPVWIDAETAVDYVEQRADGAIVIVYTPAGMGRLSYNDRINVATIFYSTRYDLLRWRLGLTQNHAYAVYEPQEGYDPSKTNYWYMDYNDLSAETLLWDGGAERPTEPIFGTSMIFKWVCLLSLGAVAFCCLLSTNTENQTAKNLLRGCTLFFGILALSVFLTTGGRFMTTYRGGEQFQDGDWFYFSRKAIAICAMWLPSFFAALSLWRLRVLKQRNT